jgi:hypothetical protein
LWMWGYFTEWVVPDVSNRYNALQIFVITRPVTHIPGDLHLQQHHCENFFFTYTL